MEWALRNVVTACLLLTTTSFVCSLWPLLHWLVLGLVFCAGLFPALSSVQWLLHGDGVPYDCG